MGENFTYTDDVVESILGVIDNVHKQLLARPISVFVAKTQLGGCLPDTKSKRDAQAAEHFGLKAWRL